MACLSLRLLGAVLLILLLSTPTAKAYSESENVGGLAGVQMQNMVSSSFLHDRGEILYQPAVRLMLDRPEVVSFSFVDQASGTVKSSWSEQLPAGSSFRLVERRYFASLPEGRYRLRVSVGNIIEEVVWIKVNRDRARTGSVGSDRMIGTAATDRFAGESGGDKIFGRGSNDLLWGDTAPDQIDGGTGDDMIDGASAGDNMQGGIGDDIIYGGYGHDNLSGGPGNDSLDGSFAPDAILGGDGNDVIHGGGGSDSLDGGAGDDQIFPDSSGDKVVAGEGNDRIYYNSGSGADSVDCGSGQDTLFLNRRGSPGFYSSRNMLEEGRVQGCEKIIWAETEADDARLGFVIQPDAGDDGNTLIGGEVNDRLLGNASSEKFFGREGDDEIWANCCFDGQGTGSEDIIDSGPGDDTVYGGFGRTWINGGPGSDYLQGGGGSFNQIDGGEGDDYIRLRGGNKGRAIVRSGPGDDYIFAVVSRYGQATVSCGDGYDRVHVQDRAKVARDCEKVKRY